MVDGPRSTVHSRNDKYGNFLICRLWTMDCGHHHLSVTMVPTRVKKLIQCLSEKNLDGFLVTKPVNVFYLSGFSGEGALLITVKTSYLITDFRYREEAGEKSRSFRTVLIGKSTLTKVIARLIFRLHLKRIGFESRWLSYREYRRLKAELKREKLVSTEGTIEAMRMVKAPSEIRLITRSCRISRRAMDYARRIIRPGIGEREAAVKIENFIRSREGAGIAFSPIVASGRNSSRPHARPGGRKIGKNDLVIVDLGASFRGYNSDLTRTIMLGKISDKKKKLLAAVIEAQERALAGIRPGVSISGIDRLARDYIMSCGLGKEFGHGLGHGVGLEIHEAPLVSAKSEEKLIAGMVVTIEPGIYLSRWAGVRWEDTVLVTGKGYRILTKAAAEGRRPFGKAKKVARLTK